MKIAFLGLGRMGSGMAQHLLRAGHELVVYNRTPERMQPLVAQGAKPAASPVVYHPFCKFRLAPLAGSARRSV